MTKIEAADFGRRIEQGIPVMNLCSLMTRCTRM